MCDSDHFKKVNDTYSHDIGDLVLKVFATTVKGMLRRDDLLGRYGGKEFMIILPETLLRQAEEVAEQIRI
ncbi:MAG: diguanylate cyclase [Rhodospirillaceae bacterium]|nr:MAG: diguanylate cyclase [Rhodospirillaceae bacterium]